VVSTTSAAKRFLLKYTKPPRRDEENRENGRREKLQRALRVEQESGNEKRKAVDCLGRLAEHPAPLA